MEFDSSTLGWGLIIGGIVIYTMVGSFLLLLPVVLGVILLFWSPFGDGL